MSLPFDGSVVVYQVGGSGIRRSPGDIWWFPATEPQTAAALIATPADETGPAISPDGSLLAYTSDESGQKEIYLQPFPQGSRSRVSTRGGESPVWSRGGDELYYVQDATLMAVAVGPGGRELGSPVSLFSGAAVSSPTSTRSSRSS